MFRLLPALLFVTVLCPLSSLQSQTTIQARQQGIRTETLEAEFFSWTSYRLSSDAMVQALARGEREVRIRFRDDLDVVLQLEPAGLLAPGYNLRVQTEDGLEVRQPQKQKLYKGHVAGRPQDRVRLTVDEGFILGFFELGEEAYYIEPARRYAQARGLDDLYILYEKSQVRPRPDGTCAVAEQSRFFHRDHDRDRQGERSAGECYIVDIALAADYLLVQEQGSVGAAENEMLAILNAVQGNYDDEFEDQVLFQVVATFVSSCSTCDPWTSSTNVDALLPDFRNWGNGGGFGTTNFDLASLWSDRNFNGSTIGYAYVGGICGSARYNINQHFTGNLNLLRVLQAHELGHNFDAFHDASNSPHIMAPAVQNTSSWSNTSINSIDNAINQVNGFCFVDCGQSNPPTADFTSDVTQGCAPLTVNFSDQSQGNPSSYNWSFPGGVPASSTASDPTVTYNAPGQYPVTLTVSNANGSDVLTISDYIQVEAPPVADFAFATDALSVNFVNNSLYATTYNWDFGDGNVSSQAEPFHTYLSPGTYTVTLTAISNCGVDIMQQVITVFPPVEAEFSFDNAGGCAPQTVQFTDESVGNVVLRQWTFPGGSPATSTDRDPVVVYSTPGTYDVSLLVSDGSYQDEKTIAGAIVIEGPPDAGFDITYTPGTTTATFTSTAQTADTYLWDFGNGQTANGAQAGFDFGSDGSYTIVHIAGNGCGSDTAEQTLQVVTLPTAAFDADPVSNCAPTQVQYTNQSSANATSYSWSFPGGDPASSTEENPLVTYSQPGTYSATLQVSNAAGTDAITQTDFLVLGDGPDPGFTFSDPVGQTSVTFSNTSQNADTYSWDFGGLGSSSSPNPSFDFPGAGTYTVTLTATNSCGSNSVSQDVQIVLPPTAAWNSDPGSGCEPLTVSFSDLSSGGVTSRLWTFPGGSPGTSTSPNPVVTYDQAGTYDVTLVVANAAGQDTLTLVDHIVVNGPPVAGFDADTGTGQTLASFTNTSTGAGSYLWDFAGLGSSTLANPSFDFPGDGNYAVQLIAQNACGSDTSIQTLAIVTLPTAAFSAGQTAGCAPFTVQLANQSSPNSTAWSWSFPGGNPSSSTQPDPVVTYDQPGLYDIQLIVSNAAGSDTILEQAFVQVQDEPQAGFTFAVNGSAIQCTDASSGADTYFWDFGDGNTSSQAAPAHTYDQEGDYLITQIVTNSCGSDTLTDSVSILFALPTAGFTADITQGCAPLTVQFFNASSADAESLEWTFEGGDPATSTATNPVVTFPQAGSFDVSLKATNASGTSTISQMDFIVVNPLPTAAFDASIDGPTVQFTNQSLAADSVHWFFGDGASSTLDFPEHTYDEAGAYTVRLIASNACGQDTASQSIVLQGQAPLADFTFDMSADCAPLQIQFLDSSQGPVDSLWWTFEGGDPSSSSEPDPVVLFSEPGLQVVSLSVQNDWGTTTLTDTIAIMGAPASDFDFALDGSTVDFVNLSTGQNLSFQWTFGDGEGSSQANPSHEYDSIGVYTVRLIAGNACGLDTLVREVDLSLVSTLSPEQDADVRLFPNPSSGEVWLEGRQWPQGRVTFRLLNALGQTLEVRQLRAGSGGRLQETFHWETLPSGWYVVQLRAGNQSWRGKLLLKQ